MPTPSATRRAYVGVVVLAGGALGGGEVPVQASKRMSRVDGR
jgi:hypothetical protein